MDMIRGEVFSLVRVFAAGIFLRAVYTGIRMKRSLIPTGNILRGIEDILYWLFSFCVLFVLWQEAFLGIPRMYGFLGVLLGMYLWYKGPEPLFFKVFVKCVAQPLKKCGKLIKLKVRKGKWFLQSRRRKKEKEDTTVESEKKST